MSEEKEGTHSLRSLKRLWPYFAKIPRQDAVRNPMRDSLQQHESSGSPDFASCDRCPAIRTENGLWSLCPRNSRRHFGHACFSIPDAESDDRCLPRHRIRFANDLYAHLQILSPSYYGRMYTGDLMSRVNNDLSAVRMVLGPSIMYSVDTFFTLLFALTMMVNINPQLTLFSLLPLPAVSWMVVRYGRVIHNRFKEVQAQFSRISTTIQENLSGIKVIKAFGREQQEIEEFRQENQTYLQLNKKLVRVWGILYPMVEMLAGVGILVVLWWGGRQVISGQFTLGEFVDLPLISPC